MAWNTIRGGIWEYDDNPPDPGNIAQRALWEKQTNGIRTTGVNQVYVKCRKVGSTVETEGELSKTYWDNVSLS